METSPLRAGRLALAYLRYSIAGGVAGAWAKFGGLGVLLTNLAPMLEPPVTQNVATASRFERAQSALRPHLAREWGSLQAVKGEFVKINLGRLRPCVNDQISEFAGRQRAKGEGGSFPELQPQPREKPKGAVPSAE